MSSRGLATTDGPAVPARTAELDRIESKIRSHVYSARIRISEHFKDYDRLHSGYISQTQFRRCLSQSIEKGVLLDDKEYAVLLAHYDTRNNGTVQYTAFIKSIDKVFGGRNLEKTPTLLVGTPAQWIQDLRPLSPTTQSKCQELIDRVRQYVRHHGFDVKSWYCDFDKHNSGFITINQYRRGFPPNLLSSEEMDTLLAMYQDPGTETVNYFKFNVHVNRKNPARRPPPVNQLIPQDRLEEHPLTHPPVGTEIILEASDPPPRAAITLDDALEHVQRHVYTHRLRLINLFCDYDRHRLGLVSEAQFRAGIKASNMVLSRQELETMVAAFKTSDGRVSYRDFCNAVDEIFTSKTIEKDPTVELQLPPREWLIKQPNKLSPEDEAIYQCVHDRIMQEIKLRRIHMMNFFKDFDKHAGWSGQITKSQFSRLLSLVGIQVTQRELYVLLDKFQDPHHVNYLNFVESVDPTFQQQAANKTTCNKPHQPAPETPVRPIDAVLAHIQDQIYWKGLRVSEFLRDFDRAKTGTVARPDFIRAFDHMGIVLHPHEAEALADRYRDTEKRERCAWRHFEADMDRAHGYFRDLEKHPTVAVHAPAVATPAAHPVTEALDPDAQHLIATTVAVLRAHLSRRSTSIKDLFHSFDHLRTGQVTRAQFRQVLSWVEFDVPDTTFAALCTPWTDVRLGRFCYRPFVAEVEAHDPEPPAAGPLEPVTPGGGRTSPTTKSSSSPRPSPSPTPAGPIDMDQIQFRIKCKVKTERLRVHDALRDFDPLQCGRITRSEFIRALDQFQFRLSPAEMNALAEHFAARAERAAPTTRAGERGMAMVDYRAFADTIETVFTQKGLERDPTADPGTFRPPWHVHGTRTARAVRESLVAAGKLAEGGGMTAPPVTRAHVGGVQRRGEVAAKVRGDGGAETAEQAVTATSPVAVRATAPRHGSADSRTSTASSLSSSSSSSSSSASGRHGWSAAHEAALERLMHRLAEDLRQRRMHFLLRFLEDHDKIHNGTITRTQFRSALSAAGCQLTDADAALVFDKYALEDHDDHIDYLAFNDDLSEMAKEVWKEDGDVEAAVARQLRSKERAARRAAAHAARSEGVPGV
ncbi:hypothetical protein AMAG_07147 [Allomyces macrogynus ATCC 38327]|uniref:Uncharacterized protein n=1 Tax=Allomyces macrogynus (strain ATCC 38327) TaxID=578462 RepID=A0A0L0SHL6_ALLM3|nr:hypothetical protein AMAG_07147 [Allomyces macrogynus ATCC 38327]|eukprot:KNE61875.1 hypothetical protein AMAG_07147 [Allomyces macrogynus ATCC 38327]